MLSKEQNEILKAVFQSPLREIASWGGGTALSEIYLHHRRSDDIDIILSDLPQAFLITETANEIKKILGADKMSSTARYNRFQYLFTLSKNRTQKLEFVYYPFPKLQKPRQYNSAILVESLLDIATSKMLAAYQRQEPKDAYDLFIILKNKKYPLNKLVASVETKFGEQIDPSLLLAKLTKNAELFSALRPLIYDKNIRSRDLLDLFQKEFNQLLKNAGK